MNRSELCPKNTMALLSEEVKIIFNIFDQVQLISIFKSLESMVLDIFKIPRRAV